MRRPKFEVITAFGEQRNGQRQMERQLVILAWSGWAGLFHTDFVLLGIRVVGSRQRQHRRTSLVIPSLELGQVDIVPFLHGRHKVVGGDGLTIILFKVVIGSTPKSLCTDQVVQHTNDFRTLVINRHGIEVVDFLVGPGADGMCHGPGVLLKLLHAHHIDVLDALHSPGSHIRAELLIAEHGETFLQTQLEPVAAGNAVA